MYDKHSFNLTARPIHGAFDYGELSRLHLDPDEVLDFSVNSNPYGPSPHVVTAIANAAIDRYPDQNCWQLRHTILEYELPATGLTVNSLVCGNGTSELIWTVARTFLARGNTVAIIGPTFGEYKAASQAVGATILESFAEPTHQFQHHVEELASWIISTRPRLVWLCNPNNPTGTLLPLSAIRHLADICQMVNAHLIIDESYHHFVWPTETFSAVSLLKQPAYQHIVVLRSVTKDFALAGVRLGYAVARSELIEALALQLPSWNVSGIAQAAGVAALRDREHLQDTMGQLHLERKQFFSALEQIGCAVVPSHTHYCLIRVGNATQIRQQLLLKKILVRDCTSFGLPAYIRVATRPAIDWQRLLRALQEVL